MATDRKREKRRLARARKNQLEKEKIHDLENEEIVEDDEFPASYGGTLYVKPDYSGVVSFGELDALDTKQKKANDEEEVESKAYDLVGNILDSDMPAIEKSRAIKSVADELLVRIGAKEVEKPFDTELLELEAFIAKDTRQLSIFDKFVEWIEKKKLTYRAEQSLSDDDFALVYEEDGKKVRKYPIHDKAHIRNALARCAQQIKAGGEGISDARKALSEIRAAAKRMGIGEMEKERNSVYIQKDSSGQWRAVMWPSNNFIDWDNEIISEAAHKEYVDWANKNMDLAPVFMSWHTAGTRREKQVDYIGYENGFLLMSAPLTEKEAAGILKAQTKTDIGMSHGSLVLERDPLDKRVITKYRMVEVSDLPLKNAANPFTDFETLSKEASMNQKEYLASVLGSEELAEKFLAKTEKKQADLRKAGIEEKETSDTPPAAEPQPAKEAELSIEDVISRVSKELGMEQLSEQFAKLQEAAEKVTVLEGLVKELAKSKDEEIAEMIAPKAKKAFTWMQERPSQKEETVLKENDADAKLKKAAPELGWLSEISGTTPIN